MLLNWNNIKQNSRTVTSPLSASSNLKQLLYYDLSPTLTEPEQNQTLTT